ncbi:unnamed protein product [Tuber melanosporum]|uniref:(Perigord truffle) hypothetical protein n=1 Tax=Tuber melanosporum (strain Mel28) TaxID=656061 RepID=D5GNE6_TUBMM|nr:uncharacterized protein GSTUM_00011248001 [Tuber melanosporum]CAZ86039.1 unnamed protein product [Tuber melanosporum]
MEQMAQAGAEPGGGNPSRGDRGRNVGGQFDTAESHGEDTSTLKGSRSKAQTESISARRTSVGSLMGNNGHTGEKSAQDTSMEEEKLTVMLRMLPIKVEINRGAIVMGNNNVPSILVAHFEKADAYIDATRSQPIDKYKQLFNFSFTHPIVEMKTNRDYKEPLSSRGSKLLSNDSQSLNKAPHAQRNRRQKLHDLLPVFSDSAESLTSSVKHESETKKKQGGGTGAVQDKWMGLSRYLDESQQEERWKFEPAEYAKVTTLVDCPSGRLSLYWDAPGSVPPPSTASTSGAISSSENGLGEDINGSQYSPPAWGIDLAFDGGTIHYGPWADRQRVFLQNMFFPRVFKTSTPAKRLTPGQDRIPTKFKLFVELSSSTILRVPTREESKDRKYHGRKNDGEVRPFGWIEVKVGPESTISYDMSMVPGKDGWTNKLNLDLKTPEVRSSVNHGLFWKADNQSLECDLSGPLEWNAKHIWRFDILSRGLKLFILREHVTLLTDLIGDWSSGPPTEYLAFTPFVYEIGLRFEDTFEVCINVNDQNIINNPSDFEDNTFIILRGAGGLRGSVVLDMTRFRPDDNTVVFDVWLDDSGGRRNRLELGVRQPVWNTWNSFLGPEAGMKLGSAEELRLKGSYNFYSAVEPGLVDTLLLDMIGVGLELKLFGFLIRYFLIVRENYFGENLHFKTLEEWQKQREEGGTLALADGGAIKSNDLDVILNLDAKDCSVVLPKKIYGAEEGIKLGSLITIWVCISSLSIVTDELTTFMYTDLQLDLSPISASLTSSSHTSQLFVDGLTIYGHRLFGLPPTEPTYICNWDIGVGSVAGECTTEFLHTTLSALKAFIFAFEDIENALPIPLRNIVIIHDVSFVRLNVKAMQIWLHLDDDPLAFRITSGEISLILNDLADEKNSERISLSLPDLTMACVDIRQDAGEAETRGYLETSLKMTAFGRKKEFSKHRSSQMKHVRESDYRTGRANFLSRDDFEGIGSRRSSLYNEDMDQTEPTLPLPGLPTPIHGMKLHPPNFFRRSAGRAASSRRAASSHAPSFHSAVESFSDALSFTPDTRGFIRTPTLTTLGSQTPKPSSTPRTYSSRSIRKPSSKVRLSSPFARPSFPLEAIELNLKNVPIFSARDEHSLRDGEARGSSSTSAGTFIDEKTAHESILVEFTPGIRGHCTAVAIKAVARLLDCVQAKTPEDILDNIQEDVVEKLAGLARPSSDSRIIEVCLKFSQLKFCFTNPVPQQISNSVQNFGDEKPDEDSFNLELRGFLIAARSKTIFPERSPNPLEVDPVKRIFSIHLLLDGLELTLKQLLAESSDPFTKPALGILVEDLLFWASTHETSNASLQIENVVSSLQSKQALFLYDAIGRTAPLIGDIEQAFGVLSGERNRMRDLAYGLAVAGARPESGVVGDPPSLTRPSYVLRSSLDHVRVHDSWKVMSRMRHIYQSLSAAHKQDVDRQCIGNMGNCPLDARRQVVGAFERWRSWELVNLEHSFVVRAIFGSDLKEGGTIVIPRTTKARIMLASLRLLVDPGPMQCEFSIRNISTAVSVGSPGESNSGGLLAAELGSSISASVIVQVHCRSIELSLTWEILDIAEGLANALVSREGDTKPHSSGESSLRAAGTIRKKKPSFHLLWTMDTGSVSLDTVNLKSLSIAYGMQASLFISEQNIELQDSLVGSALLRADLVTSELSYTGKVLSLARAHKPSLYGHFDEHCLAVTRFNIWKIAGSCGSISFNIKEEVLGLMEVIDVIVNDELSQIWKLVQGMKHINSVTNSLPKSPSYLKRTIHVVHLTLSLESFSIEATLLPSLAYLMHGNGVRLSTRPINATEEMVIDFDVLHHEHEIRTGYDRQQTRRISALQIPAINGRVRDCISAEERLLEVFLSVEAIQLDASSLQSLFNALNKPEVTNVIDEARAEWIGTQARLGEIFRNSKDAHASSAKSDAPLVYRAHAGISGLKIQTSAPSASLEIDLGSIQVHASNRPKPDLDILSIPEVHLEFRKITVELDRVGIHGALDSCGYVELHASLLFSTKKTPRGKSVRAFFIKSRSLRVDLFAETASTIVDVAGHLQDRLKDLDLSREVKYLRKLRKSKPLIAVDYAEAGQSGIELFSSMIAVEMMGIQVSWIVGNSGSSHSSDDSRQNLVLSFKRIDFATATRKENEACLTIEEFLLEVVDSNTERKQSARSENSALMPEVIFNVACFVNQSDRRLAIQAKGTSLDLRATSSVVLAASDLESSIATASEKLRHASATWKSTPTESGAERENMFGTKRLGSVLVDADFAGAVVRISNVSDSPTLPGLSSTRGGVGTPQGRYGQFAHGESNGTTILRSPGLAFKAEYVAPPNEDPSLNAEIKVSASSNTLYPSVVPLILEMTSNVKEVMRDPKEARPEDKHAKASQGEKESPPDPAVILGRCRLNIGLRICKQEFTLSCQPIARVAASTEYKEIYVTVSTCEDPESGRFYAISATVAGLRTSVRHVYSREPTGYLEVESVVVSLMNNKHLNGSEGLSCIMKLSPMKALLNVKQFQDFLLFREIWLPEEIRSSTPAPVVTSSEPSPMLVQRYHKVAATKAFPWNTTVAISEIDLQLDLGQALGRTALLISNFWVDSRKTSDWEQTMCLGFDTIRASATGRASGFVDLKNLKARTAIHWRSAAADDAIRAPLIQASLSLEQLQAKTSFDYQAFLVADITRFSFLMYNVQKDNGNAGDRLVGVLDGDRVHVYCTAQSASQGLALYQALLRLAQEKIASYQTSLKDVERYLNRPLQSNHNFPAPPSAPSISIHKEAHPPTFLSLHTDVVVSLKEVNIGTFPSTFYDNQVFKMEALNATARFAVEMEDERLHSKLEMTLGELRIALSQIRRAEVLSQDFTVEDIVRNSGATKGGTILKVPQVTAFMHTWNKAGSMDIDYIFKSAFEGKVDVGWNYSRVSFIKGMWATHVKSIAQRQGKSVSSPHITINTDASSSPSELSGEGGESEKKEKGKITAVVNVPQSRYEYNALESPIIETPQLRDMGEATPPLEWIGLHRDRLPNLTHQIVIVSLLEIAREVEDAYSKILGTSRLELSAK